MKEDEAMRGAAGEFGATAGSSLERAAESIRVLAERLAEEECRCRTFLQEVPFAVQIFDREGTQRTVNAAWEELWQARAADGIGKYNVLGDPQAESLGVADLFRRALAGESLSCPDFSFDPAVSGFPGRKRWLRSRIFPLRGPDGAVAEVAIIHEDISDLKRSEEFHRLIINHASDAVVIVRDGRLVFCNPMALALIGARSEEELLGREFSTFICPDDLDMVADIHARRLLGEKVASRYQFRIIDRQGEPRWMEASVALFEWEHAPAIVGFLSDVTDRRLIEQELADYRHHLEELIRERTRNLDELLTFSRILTATTDLRSLYREVTRLSRQLLGFDFSSLMLLAEDKSRLVMEDTIGFAESSVGTFSLVRGEGLSTYVVLAKQPAMVVDFGSESRFEIPPVVFAEKITSALGVPMMIDEEVFGVLIGHTRSRREFGAAEVALYQSLANQSAVAIKNVRHLKSLRESEQKFRLLFENAHDAIYLIDMETARIVQCNRRAAELDGYSVEELANMAVADLHPEEERERVPEKIREVATAGTVSGLLGFHHRRRDGFLVPIEISATMVEMDGRRLNLSIVRDMTERLKMEEELLRAQKLESVGVLAAGIAHDFNNLLTAIIGNLSLAKIELDAGGRIHGRLAELEKASRRAQNLTQQLLTFAKGGAPVRAAAAIGEIIRDASDFVLRGSNVSCRYHLPGDLWLVEADSGQIGQVFQNLVINGAQSMPDGGYIDIGVENVVIDEGGRGALAPGRYVKITVADHGGGIPEKLLPRIFDPYFTTKPSGSGLGLAASYSIIRKHDGLITVESGEGAGTTFSVFLPAASPRREAVAEGTEGEILPGQGRILVMDDEEMIREVAGAMVAKLGFEVVTVADGGEAVVRYVEALQAGAPFAAVILDLTVPGGLGGKDAVQRLCAVDGAVRAVVSSGYANDPIMADYAAYGFVGVIAKPYTIARLGEVLRQVLA